MVSLVFCFTTCSLVIAVFIIVVYLLFQRVKELSNRLRQLEQPESEADDQQVRVTSYIVIQCESALSEGRLAFLVSVALLRGCSWRR